MMSRQSASASTIMADTDTDHLEPVLLNIYDLSWTNNCSFCSHLGLGAYHTGVEVYGTEYGFGYYPESAHPSEASGIFEIEPREVSEIFETINFKKSIEMGHTSLTEDEVSEAIKQLGRLGASDFKGRHYHCLDRNCNHFSSELTRVLCGKRPPSWVNRLARFATHVPFFEKSVPTSWEGAELARRHNRRQMVHVTYVAHAETQTPVVKHKHKYTINEEPKMAESSGWLTGWI